MRTAVALVLMAWPAAVWAGSVTGRVSVVDKGGKPATDPQETAVWIDDIKLKAKPGNATINATVQMRGKAFVPRLAPVALGGTVTFPNLDPILHNAFSVSGENRFDLDLYKSPKSGSKTFLVPGIVRVYCNIHPQMSAVVLVLDSPYFIQAGPDGAFTLEGVPAGKHVLKAWHERGGEASTEILVPAGDGRVSAELQLDASTFKRTSHKKKDGKDYGSGESY